jgi:hypothetical protein
LRVSVCLAKAALAEGHTRGVINNGIKTAAGLQYDKALLSYQQGNTQRADDKPMRRDDRKESDQ